MYTLFGTTSARKSGHCPPWPCYYVRYYSATQRIVIQLNTTKDMMAKRQWICCISVFYWEFLTKQGLYEFLLTTLLTCQWAQHSVSKGCVNKNAHSAHLQVSAHCVVNSWNMYTDVHSLFILQLCVLHYTCIHYAIRITLYDILLNTNMPGVPNTIVRTPMMITS